jgi:L-ascorbate 6-phosphate lactonase
MAVKKKMGPSGIMEAVDMTKDRDLTRSQWLEECFPEWGTFLNNQIDKTEVKRRKVVLWWFGGPSWALKSGKEVFLIDNYAGPSNFTRYDYCGVCQTTGAERLDWLRLNPQVIDPWAFKRMDASFSTHHHADHADFYTVKALLKTTQAIFVGPKLTCMLFRKWGVPERRIKEVKPGDRIKFKQTVVVVEKNFDYMATKTTTGLDGLVGNLDYDDVAVTFIFKTSGGNIAFLGDTIYHNGYAAVGARNEVDVAILNMGHNAPGGTDKLSPFDAFRVAQALKAKVVIPDHYENWASSVIDPEQLVWIVKKNDPKMKPAILKVGAMFTYPDDQDIGYYQYPDWRERYQPQRSREYGGRSKKS